MTEKLKTYGIALLIVLIAMTGSYFAGRWKGRNQDAPLPTDDSLVSRHTVTPAKPLQALDKTTLRKQGKITKAVENDASKEILATGTISNDSGVLYVGAELSDDGGTRIIQNRPVAEIMSRNAIGIQVEANPRGIVKEGYYSRTFGRVWNFYSTAAIGGRIREDDKKEGFIRMNAELRF